MNGENAKVRDIFNLEIYFSWLQSILSVAKRNVTQPRTFSLYLAKKHTLHLTNIHCELLSRKWGRKIMSMKKTLNHTKVQFPRKENRRSKNSWSAIEQLVKSCITHNSVRRRKIQQMNPANGNVKELIFLLTTLSHDDWLQL